MWILATRAEILSRMSCLATCSLVVKSRVIAPGQRARSDQVVLSPLLCTSLS